MVAFGPSASLCFLSLAASHEGWSASVAGAGAAGRVVGVNAGLALGVKVDGGLAPVGGGLAPVGGGLAPAVADRSEGLPVAGAAVALDRFPYALAIFPSVACSLAF